MLILPYELSFQGREDRRLKDKLLTELSGVNNWALEGLRRLRTNRQFTLPLLSQTGVDEFVDNNSYALSFIKEHLIIETRLNPGNLSGVATTDKPLCLEGNELGPGFQFNGGIKLGRVITAPPITLGLEEDYAQTEIRYAQKEVYGIDLRRQYEAESK